MPRLRLVDGKYCVPWIAARLAWARKRGWQGHVISGYRTTAHQRLLYDSWKRGERAGPVAVPGTSNHEGTRWPRGAVDVSEPEQLARILQGYRGPGRKLRPYGPGDMPHFSSSGK